MLKVALGLSTVLLVAIAAAVFYVQTDKGTVVIETDDPDVQVRIKQNGEVVTIVDPKSKQKITLRSGVYQVELGEGKDRLTLQTKEFTLTRGGDAIVTVRFKPKTGREADETIDLLSRIDLERDALVGTWKLKDGVLTCPQEDTAFYSLLTAPTTVPEYYRISFEVRRGSFKQRELPEDADDWEKNYQGGLVLNVPYLQPAGHDLPGRRAR